MQIELKEINRLNTVAVQAITKTADGYFRKDGLADLEAKIEKAKDNLSSHIMSVAHACVKACKGDIPEGLATFLTVTSTAEKATREKNKDGNGKAPSMEEICPIWPVYKSQIKACMSAGIDPTAYKTKGAMQGALKAAIKAKAEEDKRSARTPSGLDIAVKEAMEDADKAAEPVHVSGAMAGAVRTLIGVLQALEGTDLEDMAVRQVLKLATTLDAKIPAKPATEVKEDDDDVTEYVTAA